MIIMMLKEKRLLNYDDSVSKYLEIPYKGITIRNLLTHTSGLPDYQDIMDKYWDKSKVAGNPDCIEYLNNMHHQNVLSPEKNMNTATPVTCCLQALQKKQVAKILLTCAANGSSVN
jgi:hypothetical protein